MIWLYLTNLYKTYFQNLKYNMKRACIFHLILVGILSILISSVKNRRAVGGFLLNWKNPLSMESYLSKVPKWAIQENANKHEWVRWGYGTSRGIEEIQSGGVFLGQKQRDLGFRPQNFSETCNSFVEFLGVKICFIWNLQG